MAFIKFNNVSVEIPIFNANNRSLKNKIIKTATVGKLGHDNSGHIIVKALQDLNFELNKGDRVGLLGANGAGKSTLLRVLSGVYSPTKGSLECSGKIASLIDISLGTDQEATGRENIFLRGAFLGFSNKVLEGKIEIIIDFA